MADSNITDNMKKLNHTLNNKSDIILKIMCYHNRKNRFPQKIFI